MKKIAIKIVFILVIMVFAVSNVSALELDSDKNETFQNIKNGLVTENGKLYYYENGKKITGFKEVNGELYFFSSKDYTASSGWKKAYGNTWYQDESGKVLKGYQEIEGKKYYFNEKTGYRESGFKEVGDILYFFSSIDGYASSGWKKAYGNTWYQDESGKVLKGYQEIEGKKYYFNEKTGYRESGFKELDGVLYFFSSIDGSASSGWVLKGLQEIDGKKYYFNEKTGYRESGFKELDGVLYFFSSIDGSISSGWKKAYGNTWYQDETGAVVTGLQEIDGKKYFFNETTGYMETGFKTFDGILYYFSGVDGSISSGWKKAYGNTWYQDETGAVVTGLQEIDGKKYFFNETTGYRESGFKKIDGVLYFFSSVDGYASSGWKYAYNEVWYQDETGVVATGKKNIENRDYIFGNDGFLEGFKNIGNTFVYYNPDGSLATGIQRMAGRYYKYNEVTGVFEKYVNQRVVIDVSAHQEDIDWDAVKNSGMVDAVILRAGYGVSWQDTYYARNVRELNRLGIPYSVYLFSYAENAKEAAMEANNLVNIIKSTQTNIASNIFSIYYDLEDWSISSTGENSYGISKQTYQEMYNSFASVISSALNMTTKIYASKNYIETRFPDSLRPNVGWVAQWGPELTYDGTYEGWQYTSSGTVPGIEGRVDMSIFYY